MGCAKRPMMGNKDIGYRAGSYRQEGCVRIPLEQIVWWTDNRGRMNRSSAGDCRQEGCVRVPLHNVLWWPGNRGSGYHVRQLAEEIMPNVTSLQDHDHVNVNNAPDERSVNMDTVHSNQILCFRHGGGSAATSAARMATRLFDQGQLCAICDKGVWSDTEAAQVQDTQVVQVMQGTEVVQDTDGAGPGGCEDQR